MKNFIMTLIIFAFASNVMMAQSNNTKAETKPQKEQVTAKHECKKGEDHECKKGEGHECKKGEGHECKKGEGHECKNHKEGQACKKTADQQCDKCKAEAKKKN